MKLIMQRPSVLTSDDMQKIYDAAIRVVRRVPLRCRATDEFYAYLRDFGCEIAGDQVRFPAPVVDKVVGMIEAQRDRARAAKKKRIAAAKETVASVDWTGQGMDPDDTDLPPTLSYSASGQGLYCCDVESDEIRLATCKDLADLSRVVDAVPGLGRAHPTFIPQDVPRQTAELHAFATIILNSSQPHRVSVYTEKFIERFFEMEVIARGGDEEAVKRNPTFACKLWFNSPFMVTEENVRIAMKARELLGQPIQISIMPVAGSATPVTIAGCMAHQTAESLVCNIITLAVDGQLTGYRSGALATDMRTGTHTQSGPDVDLLQLASAQMAEFVFGGRARVSRGPTTCAKVPGAQAMMEKSIATLFAIMGGARSFGSLATLAVADVGSIVQLMLDVEMMQYFQRLLDGVQVDEERLAEEVICEVSPTGARFMEHEHTFKYFREELFSPELADRRVAGAWIDDPTSMTDRARAKAKRLIESAPNRCPLSEADQRAIHRILAEADREATALWRTPTV
ncbi:MAG: trimethylamine methyltransferase family protein [Planctomycetota bacterium]